MVRRAPRAVGDRRRAPALGARRDLCAWFRRLRVRVRPAADRAGRVSGARLLWHVHQRREDARNPPADSVPAPVRCGLPCAVFSPPLWRLASDDDVARVSTAAAPSAVLATM